MGPVKSSVKQQEQQRAFEATDGLPMLEPLCELQASIARAYADVLAHISQRLSTATQADAAGLSILLERLEYDAPWAVSEVRKSEGFKLRRQRYISQDVFDRWRELQAQPKPRLRHFGRDASGSTLRHEHVVQRKGLGAILKTLVEADRLAAELARVTACIVSEAEDRRLRKVKGVDDWTRYRQADPPVGVYDRKEKRWLIPRNDV